jgi:ADP-ribose pyrophosphatase
MILKDKVVYSNKWFAIVARKIKNQIDPYYILKTNDFVTIYAKDSGGGILLVRQFRPALNKYTVEFPSGHVEKNETPLQAAKKELLEETGYTAKKFKLLKMVHHDTARLNNKLWFYYAQDLKKIASSEKGIKLIKVSKKKLVDKYLPKQINSSMALSLIYLSEIHGI